MSQGAKDNGFLKLNETDVFQLEAAKIEFAMELKRAMDRAGCNSARLAETLGVSRPLVSKLLRGDANVTIETMVKASMALSGKLLLRIVRENASAQVFEMAKVAMSKGRQSPHVNARERARCAWADHAWTMSANDLQEAQEAQEANEAQSIAA
ncbi:MULTISPECIES: helix-turn-helix transcriptional regulator [unclassified Pseudoxanthomonas]|uniref:helix-turn-helix domain-containing protein n=1 Tax=unclassified Pseudoxanthomonas TaxID=2645906 RepID=UPI00182E2161|nr:MULTISPECIES: helix-turn-helix transcriptional regulator [unclassified Pseudoxanthomonas]MBB3274283.1 plasmid maintenance system antidote protein VapI [Pseudoxanthomonas sp. OG2]MBV7474791.1 helix-turn-helix transcriptional regulator [Pseudoxanthomonas sp. PXM05]